MGRIGAAWGVLGTVAVLLAAVLRLAPLAADALDSDLHWVHWLALAVWIPFMAYSEGYRGFQTMYAPRVVVRSATLLADPQPLRVLFAPVFAMGLFGASKRRARISRRVHLAILAVILVVRHVPQPWRGIIDAGVVVGLGWGILAILVFATRALAGRAPTMDPELPE